MENTTFIQSKYGSYDSTFQLQFSLQIDTCTPEDDLVFSFAELVKGVVLRYL